MSVAEAHGRRARELLEPPGARGIHEEHPHDARGARREERAQGSRRGPDVALALLLDEDVLEGQIAVAREVDVPEVVALEDPGALRADVDGGRDRVGARKLPPDLRQSCHRTPDLPGLAQGAHLNHDGVLLLAQTEFQHQIRRLTGDAHVGDFFPGLPFHEKLPEPLAKELTVVVLIPTSALDLYTVGWLRSITYASSGAAMTKKRKSHFQRQNVLR